MPPYQPNIPQPTDLFSQSQSDLLGNFQALQTLIDVNHVDFASGDQGKHKWVTFPQQAVAPATGASEVALYSLLSPYTGTTELTFQNVSSGSAYEFTSAGAAGQGWARLPSGILFNWGNSVATGLSTITFNAGPTIPAFTNIFQILVTTAYVNAADGNGFVRLNSFGAPWTQFTVFASQRTTVGAAGPIAFNFLAIGI